MIESPISQKMLAEKMHEAILRVLVARFGEVPRDISSHLRRIRKDQRLNELLDYAVVCTDLSAFKDRLQS